MASNKLVLARLEEQKTVVVNASKKMKERMATVQKKETLIRCFEIFYPENLKKTVDEIEGLREQLESKTLDELKPMCLEICHEGINMDMCIYVSTGRKLGLGQKLYEALKE